MTSTTVGVSAAVLTLCPFGHAAGTAAEMEKPSLSNIFIMKAKQKETLEIQRAEKGKRGIVTTARHDGMIALTAARRRAVGDSATEDDAVNKIIPFFRILYFLFLFRL